MRAFENLTIGQKSCVSPLIELTRGRKNHPATIKKTGVQYNFQKVTDFIDAEGSLAERCMIDVTREPTLASPDTDYLKNFQNGYENWVDFVRRRHEVNPNICPVLQINPPDHQSWDDYQISVERQFDELSKFCSAIAYRAVTKNDASFDIDLQILSERIESFTKAGNLFYFVLDYDYIRPGTGDLHAIEAVQVLNVVSDICPQCVTILVSTSFPQSVTDISGPDYGDFNQEEVSFHATTANILHNRIKVAYGDYGSINPIRNDAAGGGNGWRPRIDYPYGGTRLFYYREKRLSHGKGKDKKFITTYSSHYVSVAKNIIADSKFSHDINSKDPSSWGVGAIKLAANNQVPSAHPSFWISVRMNIHIQQQLRRLGREPRTDSEVAFG